MDEELRVGLEFLTRGIARLIGNAEEVAFYGGAEMERGFLEKGFKDLKTLMEGIYSVRNVPISTCRSILISRSYYR